MGFKFKLVLHKEFEIDTKRDWGDDHEHLIDQLKNHVEPGNQADADEIHDAIRELLADEIEYVVSLDLDETNFEIEVAEDATIEVPAEDKED